MALSYVTYAGDGATTNFTFDKGYIESADVSVYVDGVLQTITTDYIWFNATTIQFLVAPAGSTVIRIQRNTENTARLVDFADAGNLTESDLDTSANQNFYLAQESQDNVNDLSMQLDTDDKWDAESKVIKNVADGTADTDAVSKKQVTDLTAADVAAAAASAAAAATSESNALSHANNASTSAGNAATSASNAATSETNAAASYDSFDDRYLGSKSSDPTLDNDGDPLLTGALYWNSSTNAMRVYSGSVWSDVGGITEAFADANYAQIENGGENFILNGAMNIWQRGTTTTGATSGDYLADRFGIEYTTSGAGTVDMDQSTTVPTSGLDGFTFANSLKVSVGTDNGAASAGDSLFVHYGVEGYDAQKLQGACVLSFWARSSLAGTYCVSLRSHSSGRASFVKEYTLAADTWTRVEIPFNIDTGRAVGSSVWKYDNDLGLSVEWTLTAGSTYNGATDETWALANNLATSSQVDWWDEAAGATFYLTGVQLERGTYASPFSPAYKSYGDELLACFRYYEKWQATTENMSGGSGVAYSTTECAIELDWKASKRANPTLGYSALSHFTIRTPTSGFQNPTSLTLLRFDPVTGRFRLRVTDSGAPFTAVEVAYFEGNVTSSYLDFSCEI